MSVCEVYFEMKMAFAKHNGTFGHVYICQGCYAA